ncbi:hypothetical protein CEXT_675611 [Caerostris extrusa]|uniref:Transposase n=1 Tax=Caerostris extrusa TaxID=172846 RepID=A0AAV4QJ99_CAEEX|nr:hypothetical protein CEXT_675611 [Caerostris extrusa]
MPTVTRAVLKVCAEYFPVYRTIVTTLRRLRETGIFIPSPRSETHKNGHSNDTYINDKTLTSDTQHDIEFNGNECVVRHMGETQLVRPIIYSRSSPTDIKGHGT